MTVTRFHLQPAYILHARPYRETSFLLDVLTCDEGRISIIAKGIKHKRPTKRSLIGRSLLQPLVPLWLSAVGRQDLLVLTDMELRAPIFFLKARFLMSALYINELCVRLIHRFDPHPALFEDYERALKRLLRGDPVEQVLRFFESALLKHLGYANGILSDYLGSKPLQALQLL